MRDLHGRATVRKPSHHAERTSVLQDRRTIVGKQRFVAFAVATIYPSRLAAICSRAVSTDQSEHILALGRAQGSQREDATGTSSSATSPASSPAAVAT
ncbi:hypothetical protein ACFXG4_37650 [Nocardia sp. NPDC059246]|uniref:hypothetical protein n=1 Tax=unclassified Nocardia TaxID=2637762 RepID=UPI0036B4B759